MALRNIKNSELFELISVRPPYFALQNCYFCDTTNTMHAEIVPEQPLGYETGVIPASEAGRHLAILGSCAVAWVHKNKKRHYYLAYKSKVELQTHVIGNKVHNKRLRVTAAVCKVAQDMPIAKTSIHLNDVSLYDIQVTYKPVQANVFEKINRHNTYPYSPFTDAYKESYLFADISKQKNIYCGVMTNIKPSSCSGHFPNIPILPIAVLIHSCGLATGNFLQKIFNNAGIKYKLLTADIEATRFIHAKNDIQLTISYTHQDNNKYTLYYEIHDIGNNDLCCKLKANIEVINN